MNFLVDISGKVPEYDEALYAALKKDGSSVKIFFPGRGLVSFVPPKLRNTENILKRLVKVLEGLINYVYVLLLVFFRKPEILHLQWLPFMEVCGWELAILKLQRMLSPKTEIILTIHNVYPHNMNHHAKHSYNTRFRKVCVLIDGFIVHNEVTKQDVVCEFNIDPSRIYVCCHGVFVPRGVVPKESKRDGGKLHVLQFGNQSFYKGTDILVEAVCGLNMQQQRQIDVRIVGGISDGFLKELKSKDRNEIITWKPYFLENEELYEEINRSDIIMLPYREISQSGVLLLSIFFNKLIICSDLPTFKETMHGMDGDDLDENLFFKSENHDSLRDLIERYINNEVDEDAVHQRIARLKDFYSWESAAKSTHEVYEKIMKASMMNKM